MDFRIFETGMKTTDTYDYYKQLENQDVLLFFKGKLTEGLLTAVLHILEEKMDELNINSQLKKRTFNVIVESFQNLYHHIEHHKGEVSSSPFRKPILIVVRSEDGGFQIHTGNHIPNDKKENIKQRIDFINQSNSDDLKELYRANLQNNVLSEKGTAGLGLIDMARKSRNKLDYKFIPIDNESSFFCLNIMVN